MSMSVRRWILSHIAWILLFSITCKGADRHIIHIHLVTELWGVILVLKLGVFWTSQVPLGMCSTAGVTPAVQRLPASSAAAGSQTRYLWAPQVTWSASVWTPQLLSRLWFVCTLFIVTFPRPKGLVMGRSRFPPLLPNLPSGFFLSWKHQGLGCRISGDVAVCSVVRRTSQVLYHCFLLKKSSLKQLLEFFPRSYLQDVAEFFPFPVQWWGNSLPLFLGSFSW